MKKIACMVLALVLLMSVGTSALAEIKIGCIAPLTGAVSVYGQLVKDGVDLYFEELNANGGLLGEQVTPVWLDDKGNEVEAVSMYTKLISEGVVAIVGPVTTSPTYAVALRIAETGMPLITASATAYKVTDPGDNIFRSCFLDPFQGKMLAQFASETLDVKTAAVLYDNTDDYSAGVKDGFIEAAEALGIEIVGEEICVAGDNDYTPQLIKIADAEPDVVLVSEYYETASLIIRNGQDVGLESTLLGADGWAKIEEQLEDVPELLDNAYYCDSFAAEVESEITQSFISAFEAKYGTAPAGFNALGYDAAMILCKAIESANSTDSAAIVEAMKATDLECVTGHVVFDDHNDPQKAVYIMGFEGGVKKLVSCVNPE